jgi:hypothetical protein
MISQPFALSGKVMWILFPRHAIISTPLAVKEMSQPQHELAWD